MIQFSKPKKTLNKAMEQFRRFEPTANDPMSAAPGPPERESNVLVAAHVLMCCFIAAVPAAASRFDASFYRTHDPVGYIQPDAQSVVSQFFAGGPGASSRNGPFMPPHLVAGRRGAGNGTNGISGTYSSYATSLISQGPASVAGSAAPSITSTQFGRLHPGGQGNGVRTGGTTDGGYRGMMSDTASEYSSYKADDDAMTTYTQSQAGVTEY